MKKKIIIITVAVFILLAILFVPVPSGTVNDGGTKEYTALTYKIVDWNKITDDGTYNTTKVYFGKDYFKTVDELWETEYNFMQHSFIGKVLEVNASSVLVKPIDGEPELELADQIRFNTQNMNIEIKTGDFVNVTYQGGVMETYPAKIDAVECSIHKDLRFIEYKGEWVNKETAEKYDTQNSSDLIITAIYKDCFFAQHVIPLPQQIKINGTLSDDWCVGDQVLVTYKNSFSETGNNTHRMECDFVSIEESTFRPDPDVAYKPVIYLYPEKETKVNVLLSLNGEFTCTYPKYEGGWEVVACPDGTLWDENGLSYNYLYWEGETYTVWDTEKGFCVKGEDTAAFLETALEKLGLTRKEANEFIVFWLPLMEKNPYNIISFQNDAYTDAAKLEITPSPDTLIRIFMTYKASDTFIEIEEQNLFSPERTGFTVIEWGGTEIK